MKRGKEEKMNEKLVDRMNVIDIRIKIHSN